MLLCQKSEAVSAPLSYCPSFPLSDSGLKNNIALPQFTHRPYNKAGLLRKLQYKLALKRLKQLSNSFDDDIPHKRNVLSTISLILGILGLVVLFIPAIAGIAFIVAPAAFITGIIALGKRYNNSKASRAKAIIGLVLGALLILLGILGVILLVALFSNGGWF